MAANPANAKLLEKVESSDFAICLDDSTPITRDEGSRACWHGDGRNRFFDKPLQFIIFENGKAGFMGEVKYLYFYYVRNCNIMQTWSTNFI